MLQEHLIPLPSGYLAISTVACILPNQLPAPGFAWYWDEQGRHDLLARFGLIRPNQQLLLSNILPSNTGTFLALRPYRPHGNPFFDPQTTALSTLRMMGFLLKMLWRIGRPPRSTWEIRWVEFADRRASAIRHPLMPVAVSADGASALVVIQDTVRCIDVRRPKRTRWERPLPDLTSTLAVWNHGFWLLHTEEQQLLLLDAATGETVRHIRLPTVPCTLISAAKGKVVIGLVGAQIALLDVPHGELTLIEPHPGAGAEMPITLCADERYVISQATADQPPVVTDISRRPYCSWVWSDLPPLVATAHRAAPGFALIEGRLALLRGGQVSFHSLPTASPPCFVSELGAVGGRMPVHFDPQQTLADNLSAAGLAEHRSELLARLRPRVLLPATLLQRHVPAMGGSRLGGLPDLPEMSAWPMWKKRPMCFFAQINLAEMATVLPADNPLPTAGLLSFFVGSDEPVDDTAYQHYPDPADRKSEGAWWVMHIPAGQPLQRLNWPSSPRPAVADVRILVAKPVPAQLPPDRHVVLHALNLSAVARQSYADLTAQISAPATTNQLLGYPRTLEPRAEVRCELAATGRHGQVYDEPQPVLPTAADWQLLLQVADDSGQWLWLIRQADLLERAFHRTRLLIDF